MMKYRLMAPGPTPVPEDVLTEMAKPIWHHRTPAFEKVVAEVEADLKWLYQTKNDVILLSSSGTGAMEASIISMCSAGDNILVVDGGKFGERFGKIGKAFGLTVDSIKVTWGQAVDPNAIAAKLKEKTYRAVCVQASETSTGVEHPIQKIGEIVKGHAETILIVDAITALGVINIPTDAWGLDIVICGSQKALMLPPGLATVSVSDKAWGLAEKSNLPKFYFNLKTERKNLAANTTAWTPAVSLIQGLRVVLQNMKKEGLEAMFARHTQMASSLRAAAKAIGLKLYAPEAPSTSVSAFYTPDGIDSGKVVKTLREKFNMTIANGQDDAKGKIIRIGHLGYYDMFDMISVWSAVEKALLDLGYKFEVGKGVAEIIKAL
jgi:aspartate aminotransferase-like enzyme